MLIAFDSLLTGHHVTLDSWTIDWNEHNTVMFVRHGTGSHFATQRPSDLGIQRPGDPVDPMTLFYKELQMSTYVADKRLQLARGLPVFITVWRLQSKILKMIYKMSIFQWQLDGFSQKFISLYLYLGIFFENWKNSGLTPSQNDDPVTWTWKMTQMTQWPSSMSDVCTLSLSSFS